MSGFLHYENLVQSWKSANNSDRSNSSHVAPQLAPPMMFNCLLLLHILLLLHTFLQKRQHKKGWAKTLSSLSQPFLQAYWTVTSRIVSANYSLARPPYHARYDTHPALSLQNLQSPRGICEACSQSEPAPGRPHRRQSSGFP